MLNTTQVIYTNTLTNINAQLKFDGIVGSLKDGQATRADRKDGGSGCVSPLGFCGQDVHDTAGHPLKIVGVHLQLIISKKSFQVTQCFYMQS